MTNETQALEFEPLGTSKKVIERIAGFFPFTPGSVLIGRLERIVLKQDNHGFYLVRALEDCTVNVDQRREEHKANTTGQAVAKAGSLVGVRAVHSTRFLNDKDLIGRIIRLEFISTEPRKNKDSGADYIYHRIDLKIAKETKSETATA